MSRTYTTRRQGIVNALVNKLKDIDGTGFFRVQCQYANLALAWLPPPPNQQAGWYQ